MYFDTIVCFSTFICTLGNMIEGYIVVVFI